MFTEELCAKGGDFQIYVFLAEGEAGHPVLLVDGLTGVGPVLGREDAGGGGEFWAGDFAANVTGGNAHLGMVADALGLS